MQRHGAGEAVDVDLSNCDREPIHVPGSIQPHGALVVLAEQTLEVLQVSENVEEYLGIAVGDALGGSLAELVGSEVAETLRPGLAAAPARQRPVLLGPITVRAADSERKLTAIAHRADGGIVLELEAVVDESAPTAVDRLVDSFSLRVEDAASIDELSQLATEEIRRLTGFDRVLIYRFDEQYNGVVVGEANSGRLPLLLDHHFPASDIPAQARELYRVNRLRLIPDSGYRPVRVVPAENPATGQPLDMSFSTLRSVSPIHVEYMRNMETASSMSVSILRDGQLWGLISCHNKEPKALAFELRTTCELFARVFSLRLAALEHQIYYQRRAGVRATYAKLLAAIAEQGDFVQALAENPRDLLACANARGAAVLSEGKCELVGETPDESAVQELAQWLFQDLGAEIYHTDSLSEVYPPAARFKAQASGLLAVAVSKLHASFVFWFRPEAVQTIKWGGNPNQPVTPEAGGPLLHPRRSFEAWKETVRNKSRPWDISEIEGVQELRGAIVGTVLQRAEEMAQLNDELTRSNKDLEGFSYSVSHDLRAPLRHIAGYAELLKDGTAGQLSEQGERWVETIIDSCEHAGMLVDKLLAFSRMGRAELQLAEVDMAVLVDEIQREVTRDVADRRITWQVDELPVVQVDLVMFREAIRNLIDNAVKYTRGRDEARVTIGSRDDGDQHLFWVQDNGVGFDQQYVGKLFGVFQRLHRAEEFEGTGIGLANVRRIVERHGGRTWAEGEPDRGATFYFTLPYASV